MYKPIVKKQNTNNGSLLLKSNNQSIEQFIKKHDDDYFDHIQYPYHTIHKYQSYYHNNTLGQKICVFHSFLTLPLIFKWYNLKTEYP